MQFLPNRPSLIPLTGPNPHRGYRGTRHYFMPNKQKKWTYMVRLNPELPATRDEYDTFDGNNVYCYLDNGMLRNVAESSLARADAPICYWEPARRAFLLESGQEACVIPRKAQFANTVKSHVHVGWSEYVPGVSVAVRPYRKIVNPNGEKVLTPLEFNQVAVKRSY